MSIPIPTIGALSLDSILRPRRATLNRNCARSSRQHLGVRGLGARLAVRTAAAREFGSGEAWAGLLCFVLAVSGAGKLQAAHPAGLAEAVPTAQAPRLKP